MKPVAVPQLDMEALFAMQKANVETLVQAQKVMLDAVQAAAKIQYGFVAEMLDKMQSTMSGKVDIDKKPEAYLADVKSTAEQAVKIAQAQMDLGMKAQAQAMDLLTKRAQQNVDEIQKIAA